MKSFFIIISTAFLFLVGQTSFAQLTLTFTTQSTTCNGDSDGSITGYVNGGVAPYIFTWSTTDTITTSNSSVTITDLPADMYWLVVEDANNNTVFGFDFVNEPSPISIDSETSTDISCNNVNDGTITINVSGGTLPYQYSIDNGSTFISNGGNFTGLASGNYQIVVRDNNACTTSGSTITITNPSAIIIGSEIKTDISCNGLTDGTISITASGGSPPYLYSIDGGLSYVSNGGNFVGLAAGNYDVSVLDSDNCSTNGSTITITEPSAIVIDSELFSDITCNGASDGTITITVSGGTSPYEYSVNGGAIFAANGGNFSGLAPGSYNIVVRDNNGCLINGSTLNLTQPIPIVVDSETKTDVNCNGGNDGTINIVASGGTPPFIYSIDGGSTFLNNGGIFTGLPAENYNVAVRDSKSCVQAGSTITLAEPAPLIIDTQVINDISCFGSIDGSITITASGGTPPYQYSIDGGITYVSNGGVFTGLISGAYNLAIKDINNCTFIGPSVSIQEPSNISIVSEVVTDVTCNGATNGTITITASGGVLPYTYSIDGGTTYVDNDGIFTSLAPANYDVVVMDQNGCTMPGSTLVINEPTPLVISSEDFTSGTCYESNDGTITIVANGGVSPYFYSIDGGMTYVENGGIFTDLPPGTYTISVRDQNVCQTDGNTIAIIEPPQIIIDSLQVEQVTCNGYTDGSIQIFVSGGNAPYTYSNDGGNTFINNGGIFTGLIPGNYVIAVKDSNGCIEFGTSVSISEAFVINIDSETATNISCNGMGDGSISIVVSGGTAPYTFSADGGITFQNNGGNFAGLGAGNYDIVVRDNNGCQANGSTLTITEPAQIIIDSETGSDVLCFGGSDGRIVIVASGGTAPYSFSVDGGVSFFDNNGVFNTLVAGSYNIVVRDINACLQTGSTIILAEPPALSMIIDTTKSTCNSSTSDGAIVINALGGTPGYTYSIDGGTSWQASPNFNNLTAGNYDVMIQDNNFCTISQQIVLESKFTVNANAGSDAGICPGGSIMLQGSGGTNYSWQPTSSLSNPNISNPVASPSVTTTYTLTVTEGVCSENAAVTISIYDVPGLGLGADTVIFRGSTITLRASDGFESYSWTPTTGLSSGVGQTVQATPENSIIYKATGTTSEGCINSDSISISVISELKIPSGLTPNGDGYNDTWEIDNAYLFPSITVQVVNRWGQKVFFSRGYGNGIEWDGTNDGKTLPTATYYYVIDLNDGRNTAPMTGPVTIVR